MDQCSYQGFSKRKKDQSAAAKVRVELGKLVTKEGSFINTYIHRI